MTCDWEGRTKRKAVRSRRGTHVTWMPMLTYRWRTVRPSFVVCIPATHTGS